MRSPPLRPLLAATAALATSLGVFIACGISLREPLMHGTAEYARAFHVARTTGAGVVIALTLAGLVLARSPRITPRPRMSFVGACAAIVALVGLLAASWVVSKQAHSRDSYLPSLPTFARLPAQIHIRPRTSGEDEHHCRDVIPIGAVSIVRDCAGPCRPQATMCSLGIVRSDRHGPSTSALDVAPRSAPRLSNSRELRVRLDDARDVMFVDDDYSLVALDLRALRPRDIGPWNLVPVLAPPRAWITFAATGLLLALALLLTTRRRAATEPVDATLRPDGALVLDGRALTGVVVPPEVAPGPVVVFLAKELGALHYRDDAPQSGARVESGTLAAYRARVTERAGMWAALAWALAALAGAPLAAWGHSAVTALTARRPAAAPALPAAYEIEGVRVEQLAAGHGAVLREGQTAELHYTGTLRDGTVFDSSWEHSAPFSFPYGSGRVIPGFERGMRGMRVGERRRITIPPALGYGDRAMGDRLPAGSTLIFEVQLLAVR
jgi:peptidylprolyl isomerase